MGNIELTPREQERYDTIRSCIAGDITNKEASVRLGLKVRQVQRMKRAFNDNGEKGVLHKSKGKTSHNATDGMSVKSVFTFFA